MLFTKKRKKLLTAKYNICLLTHNNIDIKTKMVRSCWICKTSGNTLKKSYFRIPKVLNHRNSKISELSALRKEKWQRALVLPEETSGIRICSDHFLSGNPSSLLDVNDPDWIPTQNLIYKARKDVIEIQKLEGTRNLEGSKKSKVSAHLVTCRLCGRAINEKFTINIFKSFDSSVLDMISAVLGHKVVQDERLPDFGCHSCLKKIKICHKLLTIFRNNESFLTSTYNLGKASKDLEIFNAERIDGGVHVLEQGEEGEELFKETEDFLHKKQIETIKDDRSNERFGSLNIMQNKKVTGFVLNRSNYDRDLIHSIIENHSVSSDEDFQENSTVVKQKRKYNAQAIKIKPIELKTLKCNNCYKKFIDISDLKLHKNFCKLFYCQLCKPQVFFSDKSEQILHKKKYHSQSLVCHVCGKNYSQSYLLKHFKNHFENKKKCPYCSKILKNDTILMAHIDNFHDSSVVNICEFCGGCFKNLKGHSSECGSKLNQNTATD